MKVYFYISHHYRRARSPFIAFASRNLKFFVQRPALICRLDVIIASFRCRLSSFNVPRPITCVTPSVFSGNHQFIIALFFFSGGWWNEFIHSRTKSRWYRAVIHENKIREKQKQKTKQKKMKKSPKKEIKQVSKFFLDMQRRWILWLSGSFGMNGSLSYDLSKAFSAFVCFGSLSYLWLNCDYILEIKYL